MSTMIAARGAPPMAAVLRHQMRLLHWSGRTWFLAALTFASLAVAAPILAAYGYDVSTLYLDFAPAMMFMSGLFGIFVWRDEPPTKRDYHWTLPLDAGTHDIMRVAAGGVWLTAAIVLFTVTGAIVAFAAGGSEAWLRAAPLMLPHYFLSSYIIYLLAAAMSTRSRRPIEYVIFGYIGVVVLLAIAELAALPWLTELVQRALGRPYGLGWAVAGAWISGEAAAEGTVAPALTSTPGEWLPVALLWLAIGVTALYAAARARIDRV